MKAKKQFGQNFLIDENVLDGIANAVDATERDLIIEIGPGRGALTKKLLDKGCCIIAYEIDTDMKFYLSSLSNNLCVKYQDILTSNINEDISKYDYENLYIVGNLP